jgi:hypothetical protein
VFEGRSDVVAQGRVKDYSKGLPSDSGEMLDCQYGTADVECAGLDKAAGAVVR